MKIRSLCVIYPIIVLTLFFFISCSNDDENPMPNDDIYLSIPDSELEKMLIAQGIDSDLVVNHKMLKSDAKAVTRLDLNFKSHFGEISDLTGIEGFVNIKLLSAGGQHISHVDLSHNTLLDTLYLSANMISNIDLSNNTNLIFVDLQSNRFNSVNSITGLSNISNLKDLDLSWNYLQEFSIHNKSLEVLHISHNDLKSINTNGAVNLRNIFMPSNKLETVNFSTNISLETLLISGNKLQQIDLDYNINLTHLYISSNELTSLNASNNPVLVDLRVDRNTGLTCIKIQENQYIPTVYISDYQELNKSCN